MNDARETETHADPNSPNISMGAKRLVLSTAATNHEACALYESSGYKPDDVFLVYKLEL